MKGSGKTQKFAAKNVMIRESNMSPDKPMPKKEIVRGTFKNRCQECGRDMGSILFPLCGWCAGVRGKDEPVTIAQIIHGETRVGKRTAAEDIIRNEMKK